jgi:hypothetical protein
MKNHSSDFRAVLLNECANSLHLLVGHQYDVARFDGVGEPNLAFDLMTKNSNLEQVIRFAPRVLGQPSPPRTQACASSSLAQIQPGRPRGNAKLLTLPAEDGDVRSV